jgi:hypothetical protein
MKNILIIWELPYSDEKMNLYNHIIKTLFSEEVNILSPIDTLNFKWTPEERYKRAFDSVANSDLIIAECSKPSSGQGMEIRESVTLWVPLIVIAETDSKVSGLILASPNIKDVIYYDSLEDLENKLNTNIILWKQKN